MDRKRYQKIKKYVVIYIVFSLLFSLCLYMQIHLERMAEQRRMLTLLESHPEWEAEIVALWYKSDDSHMMAGTDERTGQGIYERAGDETRQGADESADGETRQGAGERADDETGQGAGERAGDEAGQGAGERAGDETRQGTGERADGETGQGAGERADDEAGQGAYERVNDEAGQGIDNRIGKDAYNETVQKQQFEETLRLIEDKYGHDLKCILSDKKFVVFWGAGMLTGAALTALLGYWEKHRKYRNFELDETYQELYECLEQFQRGNFRQVPEYNDLSEAQMKLWETVRELGVYFEGLKERLEEEEDSTKALITDISHQLKTPLTSLRMSYELVTSAHITEEERKEFQEQEAKEIEKLEMLLAELVNLSRLEKHVIQIKPAPASLKNTITDAVSRIYMKARNKNIEIQVEMEQDFEICHDGKWTAEALVNILDNAVKYSDEHTTITVRVQPLVKNVLIEIEDEGIGIRPEELVRIYQRFYRGNEAREKVKEGAGVGLYLSRMILERQGGTITAKRRVERGTVFRITLPG